MADREPRINEMGSVVEDGYRCKPLVADPQKAMMYYKSHIFICCGDRCRKAWKRDDLPSYLRDILKSMRLHKGSRRIKISTGGCFGTCRFRTVAKIYENSRGNGFSGNDNLWLKAVHRYDESRWRELFETLDSDIELLGRGFESIEMKEYD